MTWTTVRDALVVSGWLFLIVFIPVSIGRLIERWRES